ncbi:MAG: hypothetical protein ABSD52_02535 [Candidatus Cybelea sp.]
MHELCIVAAGCSRATSIPSGPGKRRPNVSMPETNIFNDISGGAHPWGTLVFANGALCGTASLGGSSGIGTIFRVIP